MLLVWHQAIPLTNADFIRFIRETKLRLTHLPLRELNEILEKQYSTYIQWLMTEASLVKLPLDECHWTSWWQVNIDSSSDLVLSVSSLVDHQK